MVLAFVYSTFHAFSCVQSYLSVLALGLPRLFHSGSELVCCAFSLCVAHTLLQLFSYLYHIHGRGTSSSTCSFTVLALLIMLRRLVAKLSFHVTTGV
jgi:hypothetical protein